MTIRRLCKCRGLCGLLLLFLAAQPTPTRATGIEDPTRWLGAGSTIVLDAPEFFFEFETARIAADLHPEFKAVVPEGIGSDREYAKQTDTVDAADFEDALATGALVPPDPAQARAAHLAAIKSLDRTNRSTESESTSEDAPADLPEVSPTPTPTPSATAPPAAAAPLPEEFASEFADYHRGARAYHIGDTDAMNSVWQALLQRPAAERRYRTVWVEYMLGKAALEADLPDEARAHFRALREAVKGGARDSLGLAAASIGWEAKLEFDAKHYPEAARLYLTQRGTGDPTAVNSLHTLMNQIAAEVTDLTQLMNDPLLQRLATAAALTGIGDFGQAQSAKDPSTSGASWLALLESADAKQVKDADCVAWMEYQKGDYKAAQRWLKVADANSPYALWLQAKLALRDGKVDAATQLLSRALPRLPEAHALESRYMEFEMTPGDTSKGELGALRVGRADFIAATKLFMQVDKSDDAIYLAEAVLTLPELNAFIDREVPATPKPERTDENKWSDPERDLRTTFREIVGRRLVRAGKFAEAKPYFDEETQKTLDEYVTFLAGADDTHVAKAERAAAFWKAAELIVDHGSALFDYALPAGMAARLSGRAVELGEYPETTLIYGKAQPAVPPVTEKERARLKQNIVPTLHRSHAIYVAADVGWRAAALLPDNEDHTADLLNTAGSWLKNRDEKAADRFYQAIERRCFKTALGKEAIKRHWFVPGSSTTTDE